LSQGSPIPSGKTHWLSLQSYEGQQSELAEQLLLQELSFAAMKGSQDEHSDEQPPPGPLLH